MARGRKDYEKAVISVESEGYRDLHGRILMQDDFEDTPLKWSTGGTGTWTGSRQARAAYNGSYGLELTVISDIPPTARYAHAGRHIPIDVTERILVELFWRVNLLTRLQNMDLDIYFYDGTRRHTIGISYVAAAAQWQYEQPGGGMANIPGGAQTFFSGAWNELTISADFAVDEYISFKSNNLEINMGGLPCWNAGSGIGAHGEIGLRVYNSGGTQLVASFDDAVVRELEV